MSRLKRAAEALDILRKLVPLLVIVGPFALASWMLEKPLRRVTPVVIAEILILGYIAHDMGLLPVF